MLHYKGVRSRRFPKLDRPASQTGGMAAASTVAVCRSWCGPRRLNGVAHGVRLQDDDGPHGGRDAGPDAAHQARLARATCKE